VNGGCLSVCLWDDQKVNASEDSDAIPSTDKPWAALAGGLRNLHAETLRINQLIEDEFEQIEPEEWK
jgi:hypothetical protein